MLFTLNTLLVLMIFKFLFWISVMSKNDLIRKIRLISKFMTPQSGKQIVAKHILTNISRRKGNQAMIFGQFIERNMRNFFFENSYTKCDRDIFPIPFSKKTKLSISLDQYSKVSYSLFYGTPSWGVSEHIETKLQTICFYLTTKGLELVSLSHFLHDFWRKMFILLYSST